MKLLSFRVIRLLLSITVVGAFLISGYFEVACAAEVTLSWKASTDPNVKGYKIYYDTDSGPPYRPASSDFADEGPPPIIVDKDKTKLTLHGLTDSKNYFFSVTTFYDPRGPESDFSEEISLRPVITRKPKKPDGKIQPARSSGEGTEEIIEKKKGNQPVSPPEKKRVETDDDAVIRAGDYLEVDIPTDPQLSQNYDVDPDGYIHMPLLGKIKLDGMTLSEAREFLVLRLKRFVKKIEPPNIRILASRRFILIQGGVRYPGWYHVPEKVSVEELISLSGGLVKGVDGSSLQIRRRVGNTYQRIPAQGTISLSPSDILEVPIPDEYNLIVDAGDLLFIRIPEQPVEASGSTENFRQLQIEVDRFGYIALPVFGNVFVRDRSTAEIEEYLTSRLPKYLSQSSKAQVSIIEKRHYVQVMGHVNKPGWYNIAETANVQMALNAAGGAIDGAIMSDITVQRKMGQDLRSFQVNVYNYTVVGDERLLLPLQENDTVFVPISAAFGNVKRTLNPWSPPESRLEKEGAKKVRVTGAVNAPGIYEPTADMNFLELLVQAGGEAPDADLSNIQVVRENKLVKVNIKQLMEDSQEIPKVQSGDVVRIPYLVKAGYRPLATVEKVRIIGAVNKPGGYEVLDNMTVLDLLAFADGQHPEADMSNIVIIRANGEMERYNMEDFFNNPNRRGLKELPRVFSGDLVQINFMAKVGYIKAQNVYVLGKVRSPGVYELFEGMGVLQAIARAGGLDEWAHSKKITILRRTQGKQENILYNYEMGISGKYPELNIRLKADDIVYVPGEW